MRIWYAFITPVGGRRRVVRDVPYQDGEYDTYEWARRTIKGPTFPERRPRLGRGTIRAVHVLVHSGLTAVGNS